jgi:hypothetical protein
MAYTDVYMFSRRSRVLCFNLSRSWSLGDSEQYVCMDCFSTTWIESVSFHIPSGVDCQKEMPQMLCAARLRQVRAKAS